MHFAEALPDFGDAPAVACRTTGYVLGVNVPGNPLQFSHTFDSSKVTCKACIKLLAKRTAKHLTPAEDGRRPLLILNGTPLVGIKLLK